MAHNCALFFAGGFGLMTAMKSRQAKIARNTKETRIAVSLNLDGKGKSSVKTGIPFFDHMFVLFAKHAIGGFETSLRR